MPKGVGYPPKTSSINPMKQMPMKKGRGSMGRRGGVGAAKRMPTRGGKLRGGR